MTTPQLDPEHSWASQLALRPDRLPLMEPHDTKKDDKLIQYLMDRCVDIEYVRDETTDEIKQEVKIIYQNILDTIFLRLSHLESVSNLDSQQCVVQYGKWALSQAIMEVEYDALEDAEALHLIGELDATVFNILWGRANEGTHQLYDASVAGSRRSVTVEGLPKKGGGLFGRGR